MIVAHLQHARGEIEANKVPDTAGFIKPYKCTEFRQGFMKWALAENLSDLRLLKMVSSETVLFCRVT